MTVTIDTYLEKLVVLVLVLVVAIDAGDNKLYSTSITIIVRIMG